MRVPRRSAEGSGSRPSCEKRAHGALRTAALPRPEEGDLHEDVPETEPVTVPASVPAPRAPRRAPSSKAKTPERVFAKELAAGELPSIRRIKQTMRCGTPRAREIRDGLAVGLRERVPEAA